jgi:hypothetical protein
LNFQSPRYLILERTLEQPYYKLEGSRDPEEFWEERRIETEQGYISRQDMEKGKKDSVTFGQFQWFFRLGYKKFRNNLNIAYFGYSRGDVLNEKTPAF